MIYNKILGSAGQRLGLKRVECEWAKGYLERINEAQKGQDLKSLVLTQEEMTMHVFAKMVMEIGRHVLTEDDLEALSKIAEDELEHEELLAQLVKGDVKGS